MNTTVPSTCCQVVNATIGTVDEFVEGILDRGAYSHYREQTSEPYCSDVSDPLTPNQVQNANGEDMQAVKQVKFQLSEKITGKAQQEYTHNDLKTGTLFSVRQVADENFISIFSKNHANVFKNGKVIIKGRQNLINGLYNTPLARTAELSISSSNQQQSLGLIQNPYTRQELAGYFHACMFSFTPTTFL